MPNGPELGGGGGGEGGFGAGAGPGAGELSLPQPISADPATIAQANRSARLFIDEASSNSHAGCADASVASGADFNLPQAV
jgi:hypothetical protein